MIQDRIAIVAASRTPIGAFQGKLSTFSAPQLGGYALKATLEDCNFKPEHIEELLMGCVIQAGLGQNPARQAGFYAGFKDSTDTTTINKVCGSGMKSIMLAADLLKANSRTVIAAGGMESMTNAPYLLTKGRSGYRFGHGQLIDALAYDGLEDAYQRGCSMGAYAEKTAEKYNFSRDKQDQYAIRTTEKALNAMKQGWFKKEITPIPLKEANMNEDETPLKVKIEKIPYLKPAFKSDGTVTAASSSSLSDGAASLIIMLESQAHRYNLPIRAYISGYTTYSQSPEWFTLAPIGAIDKLMKNLNWSLDDIDLYEINEAFAVVTLAAIQELKLDPEKVNVHGGACALGHPIGASGARLIVTLLHSLETHQLKKGIACLCIGGGEATALAIEVP